MAYTSPIVELRHKRGLKLDRDLLQRVVSHFEFISP